MSKSQQQVALLGALAAVMVGVYARALKPPAPASPSSEAAPADVADEGQAEAAPLPPVSAQRAAQRERAAQLGWTRDPFMRGLGAGLAGGFALNGILWDETAPIAMVSGQMVGVGDTIEGYRVTEIRIDRVVLSDGDQTHELLVSP
jgi:hypothetical protein